MPATTVAAVPPVFAAKRSSRRTSALHQRACQRAPPMGLAEPPTIVITRAVWPGPT
jgi:hypothetical protein